jgi:hypothetical protein
MLSTDKVLVAIGTPCSMSAVGSTQTFLARVAQSPEFLGFADFVPTLRRLDPDLGSASELFNLQSSSVAGDNDGGALCSTQGFGGYNGAIALLQTTIHSRGTTASEGRSMPI